MNAYRRTVSVSRLVSRARLLLDAARETLADAATPARERSRSAASLIAAARALWTRVRLAIALGGVTLRHTYNKWANGYTAVLRLTDDDNTLFMEASRTYAHRQSAQRAALRMRGAFVTACEDAALAGTLRA